MWTKYCIILLAFLVACGAYEVPETVKALGWDTLDFQQLPTPADLAFGLSEDEFEDYLNFWLQKKTESSQENTIFHKDIESRAPCTVNLGSLFSPQPVYVSGNILLAPSNNLGNLVFTDGQEVTMACPGNQLILHYSQFGQVEAVLKCNGQLNKFSNPIWPGTVDFDEINCYSEAVSTEVEGGSCPNIISGSNIITVGLKAAGQTHTIFTSCVDVNNAKVYYVEYDQAYNNVIAYAPRPDIFKQEGNFGSGLKLETVYADQWSAFESSIGNGAYNKYVNSGNFLNKGHLAAKADFVFSPAQTATFTYVNVAPQWSKFNAGNWNTLEKDLRAHIGSKNFKTKIFTGTFGNLQLKDNSGTPRNLYLSPSGSKVPVPLWFYKVVYDSAGKGRATAFLGLNNPHMSKTEADAEAKKICIDQCDVYPNNFTWLHWQKTDTDLGYSTCCTLDAFRLIVNYLPPFTVDGLFS